MLKSIRAPAILRHRHAVPVTIAAGALLMMLGVYLALIRPGVLAREARANAEQEVQVATNQIAQAKGKVDSLTWFNETYLIEPNNLLGNARSSLSGNSSSAQELLRQAQSGSHKTKRALCLQALDAAKAATTAAKNAERLAGEALASRTDANSKRSKLVSDLQRVTDAVPVLTGRIDSETKRYISSYGLSARKRSDGIAGRLQQVAGTLQSVTVLLPPENSMGKGDPRAALTLLGPALTEAGALQGEVGSLTEWLTTADKKHTGADAKVGDCERLLAEAKSGLGERQRATAYWLKSAVQLAATADASVKDARVLLTAIGRGETLPDRIFAYERAEEAAGLCGKVVPDADREIALAKAVLKALTGLESDVSKFSGLQSGYDSLYITLRNNHAESAWSQVRSIRDQCGFDQLVQARKDLARAKALVSLDVQDFTGADALTGQLRKEVGQYIVQAEGLGSFVAELEGYRKNYPAEAKRSNDVIDGERSKVTKYGSSNTSARNSFNDGVRSLERAREHAKARRFADAMQDAKLAATQAKGTGAKCKKSYDDEQAAIAAAAAVAKALLDSDSGSSSSGGSGWGSSGSGSSGSSWGSGSSGGSDSGWGGGGSDSGWGGGGSDSDW